jgi:hypothetical protein
MKTFSFLKEGDTKLPEQITFEINATELRELSGFLLQCATEIENDVEWEHEHFSDYIGRSLECDLVIYNSLKK